VLEMRGHTVMAVGEAFPAGSPDPSILIAAEAHGAVIFTSDTDWQKLINSVPSKSARGSVQNAGRVLFNCSHVVAAERLNELIEDIEREFERAVKTGGRLMMRITGGNFRVER
jgi:hypothetical protein